MVFLAKYFFYFQKTKIKIYQTYQVQEIAQLLQESKCLSSLSIFKFLLVQFKGFFKVSDAGEVRTHVQSRVGRSPKHQPTPITTCTMHHVISLSNITSALHVNIYFVHTILHILTTLVYKCALKYQVHLRFFLEMQAITKCHPFDEI